jgi:hypothetical protein
MGQVRTREPALRSAVSAPLVPVVDDQGPANTLGGVFRKTLAAYDRPAAFRSRAVGYLLPSSVVTERR